MPSCFSLQCASVFEIGSNQFEQSLKISDAAEFKNSPIEKALIESIKQALKLPEAIQTPFGMAYDTVHKTKIFERFVSIKCA